MRAGDWRWGTSSGSSCSSKRMCSASGRTTICLPGSMRRRETTPASFSRPRKSTDAISSTLMRVVHMPIGSQAGTRDERIETALEEIVSLLGDDVKQKYIKGHATMWDRSALFGGAFASARPGQFSARTFLTDPALSIEDRIFLAGEACHKTDWATVAGAHQSGCATAQRVIKSVIDNSYSPVLDCCNTPASTTSSSPCTCAFL